MLLATHKAGYLHITVPTGVHDKYNVEVVNYGSHSGYLIALKDITKVIFSTNQSITYTSIDERNLIHCKFLILL